MMRATLKDIPEEVTDEITIVSVATNGDCLNHTSLDQSLISPFNNDPSANAQELQQSPLTDSRHQFARRQLAESHQVQCETQDHPQYFLPKGILESDPEDDELWLRKLSKYQEEQLFRVFHRQASLEDGEIPAVDNHASVNGSVHTISSTGAFEDGRPWPTSLKGGKARSFSLGHEKKPYISDEAYKDEKKVMLYKTEMCRAFEETGKCKFGTRCLFAHDRAELRLVKRHPRYKTEVCRSFYEEGICKYGRRCCFLHFEKGSQQEQEYCQRSGQLQFGNFETYRNQQRGPMPNDTVPTGQDYPETRNHSRLSQWIKDF
ncbi:hypothetical protein MP228_002986 [Amoeboaphelidium protococcarum]|nr:hypothetical protein MP228_002986 [Amoeboaphelidium protococcarum]